jgi:hypothetical protein
MRARVDFAFSDEIPLPTAPVSSSIPYSYLKNTELLTKPRVKVILYLSMDSHRDIVKDSGTDRLAVVGRYK